MRGALLVLTCAGCSATLTAASGDSGDPGGPDLAGLDFAGVDFSSAALTVTDLSGVAQPADLSGDLLHPRVGPQTVSFTLDAGVFPPVSSHPSALFYVPSGFDPTPPINLIVYIHGFSNCVTNIIRDAGGSCHDGGVTRNAYSLASQLEASGKNALLFAPEVAFEQATGNPGTLTDPTTFAKLLQESLDHLAPVIGARTLADIGELIIASHSGGYTVADDINKSNGVTAREIWMFDSLYSSSVTVDFENWIKQDLGSFYAPWRRFGTFYTIIPGPPYCQGTDCNSENLAAAAKAAFPADAGVVIDEPSSAVTWTDDLYRHGVLCKHSSLAHDDIPRYYFIHLLNTSALPSK
jgi:hypothetical protein